MEALSAKGVSAEVGGVRREVAALQQQHGQLTAVEMRIEKLCSSRKGQVSDPNSHLARSFFFFRFSASNFAFFTATNVRIRNFRSNTRTS